MNQKINERKARTLYCNPPSTQILFRCRHYLVFMINADRYKAKPQPSQILTGTASTRVQERSHLHSSNSVDSRKLSINCVTQYRQDYLGHSGSQKSVSAILQFLRCK